jgi:uroporphyrinogen-III synthase
MPLNKRYRILSTKAVGPELVSTAAEQHIDLEHQAFIEVHPRITDALKLRIHELLQQQITAIFTSKNAVNSIVEHYLHADGKSYHGGWANLPQTAENSYFMPGWYVHCLNGATKDAVDACRNLFMPEATTPDAANIADLVAVRKNRAEPVVFFCGNIRRDVLPQRLKELNIDFEELIVYDTTETMPFTTQPYDGILFFSPSAVRSFFSVNQLPPQTICFAIGQTTAGELSQHTSNKIIVSAQQSLNHVVQTAINYFNNIN